VRWRGRIEREMNREVGDGKKKNSGGERKEKRREKSKIGKSGTYSSDCSEC